MKKMKYLRTWLVAALLVTIIGSLTGGTVAWFTDNVESTGNVIEAGTLNIDLLLKRDGAWISLEEKADTKVFDYKLWEPGYTQVETLTIINKGNLALEYVLNVTAANADSFTAEDGSTKTLANAIDVYMAFGEKTPSSFSEITEANGWWKAGTLSSLIADEKGFTQGVMLPSGAQAGVADGTVIQSGLMQGSCTCTIALHMQEEAGNEYQGLSLGDLGFVLKAKQAMYEEDSFDEKYDENAEYGEGVVTDDTPTAMMRELKGDELKIYASEDWLDVTPFGERVYGEKTLDCGVVLSATESDVTDSPYEKCFVDILLSCDRVIEPGMEITLAGHYDFLSLAESGHWLAAKVNDLELPANERVRVMESLFGNPMRYDEIVEYVKEFFCGVIADDSFNGATITMELCVYDETDNDYENPTVVESYSYTF